jgi:hypothetical protein
VAAEEVAERREEVVAQEGEAWSRRYGSALFAIYEGIS